MASVIVATGCSAAAGSRSNGASDFSPPRPSPSVIRPPLNSSTVAAVAASAPGWRRTGEVIPTARPMVDVSLAAAARIVIGSLATPSSAIQTSSNPHRSAATTASTNRSAGPAGNSHTPTRGWIEPSVNVASSGSRSASRAP